MRVSLAFPTNVHTDLEKTRKVYDVVKYYLENINKLEVCTTFKETIGIKKDYDKYLLSDFTIIVMKMPDGVSKRNSHHVIDVFNQIAYEHDQRIYYSKLDLLISRELPKDILTQKNGTAILYSANYFDGSENFLSYNDYEGLYNQINNSLIYRFEYEDFQIK